LPLIAGREVDLISYSVSGSWGVHVQQFALLQAHMGLLTILKKIKQAEKEMRLLVLGLDNAGKTTIIKKFMGEAIDTISPTLGFNIVSLEFKKCGAQRPRPRWAHRRPPAPPPAAPRRAHPRRARPPTPLPKPPHTRP
jgi:hypothetical protein